MARWWKAGRERALEAARAVAARQEAELQRMLDRARPLAATDFRRWELLRPAADLDDDVVAAVATS